MAGFPTGGFHIACASGSAIEFLQPDARAMEVEAAQLSVQRRAADSSACAAAETLPPARASARCSTPRSAGPRGHSSAQSIPRAGRRPGTVAPARRSVSPSDCRADRVAPITRSSPSTAINPPPTLSASGGDEHPRVGEGKPKGLRLDSPCRVPEPRRRSGRQILP